jgi:hypothetical protein
MFSTNLAVTMEIWIDRVEGKKKKMKLHCGWERWGRCWIPLVRTIFPYSITTQAASGRSGARTSALKVKAPGQSPEFTNEINESAESQSKPSFYLRYP